MGNVLPKKFQTSYVQIRKLTRYVLEITTKLQVSLLETIPLLMIFKVTALTKKSLRKYYLLLKKPKHVLSSMGVVKSWLNTPVLDLINTFLTVHQKTKYLWHFVP